MRLHVWVTTVAIRFRVDKLIAAHVDVLSGGHDMEEPSPSECVAALGSDNV